MRAHGATRRAVLRGAGAVLAAGVAPSRAASFCSDAGEAPAPLAFDGPPLGELDRKVSWGVALAAPADEDPALIRALARERPNFVAVASGFKFDFLYPSEARCLGGEGPDWSEADKVLSVANNLRVPFRGDCLAWNDWVPEWAQAIAHRREKGWRQRLQACFERHFTDVFDYAAHLSRRPGASGMRWCGLVNEPFNPWYRRGDLAAWRTGIWLDAFGSDESGTPRYIDAAFELGGRLRSSPSIALYLNEANCDNDRFGPLVRPALLNLVDTLLRKGRRIDAVGLECHLVPQWMDDPSRPDWSAFVAFLHDLSRRGVGILLTELDVNDCSQRDRVQRDALVADTLSSFVRAALSVPAVTMVTNWDFSDKYSWLRDDGHPGAVFPFLGSWASCVRTPACPRPDVYDQLMRPKAARRAFAQALAAAGRT